MTIEQQGTATPAAPPTMNAEQALSEAESQWLKLDSRLRGALALIEKHAEDSVDVLAAQLLVEEALQAAGQLNRLIVNAQKARYRKPHLGDSSSNLRADLPAHD